MFTRSIVVVAAGRRGIGRRSTPRSAGRSDRAGAAADDAITPAEIQRMFDAYALLQAQEQLQISDDQHAFRPVRALQDTRRAAGAPAGD